MNTRDGFPRPLKTLVYFIGGILLEERPVQRVIQNEIQKGTNDTKYCQTSSSLKRPLFHVFRTSIDWTSTYVTYIHLRLKPFYNGHDGSSLQTQLYFRSSRPVKGSDDCVVTSAFAANRNGNVLNRTPAAAKSFAPELLKSAPTVVS